VSPEPPIIILFILSCLNGPALCRSLISDSQLKAFVTNVVKPNVFVFL